MDNNTPAPYFYFLIVGLGNPGREYKSNRHNVGFMFADRLAQRLQISFLQMKSKALITNTNYQGRKLFLAKPQMYMNLSGQSIAALWRFYKIPLQNLLVAYDDIDLPFGCLRLRPEGGSAGHNGMKSIIEKLGAQDFPRLRIGVNRPPGRMEPADYVLQDFNKIEIEQLPMILNNAVEAALYFVNNGIEAAMNQYNTSVIQTDAKDDD